MTSTLLSNLAVVYFGMGGRFSAAPLAALLRSGVVVRAVVMPAPARLLGLPPPPDAPAIQRRPSAQSWLPRGSALPLLNAPSGPTIARIADDHQIPVLEVMRLRDLATLTMVRALRPDVLCVACFPWRLPADILRVAPLGCLNVHPSLLPANRGPDPLFWTFREGARETGVTIHMMEQRLDSGPIVTQRALPVPEGITEEELERQCAELGGTLLVEAAVALAAGTAEPCPQAEALATSHSWPTDEDYIIPSDRPAAWAHRFVCGVIGRGVPLSVAAEGHVFRVLASLGYDDGGSLDVPWQLTDTPRTGATLALRCAPGVWRARVAL